MADFEKFKNDILLNSCPFSNDEIVKEIDEINKEAHKKELFTEQLGFFLTELPVFSINKSKTFAIKYLEEYHKWLTENFNITPKNQ